MALVEDDAEVNPTVAPSQLNYIRGLTDSHKQYTRFFDALLVPRPSHGAFFRDLKGFRALPTTIKAFTLCDPNEPLISPEQRKENYKDVTRKYLGSRFAHPWCRKAMAGMGNTKIGGWWAAEWAATGRKMSKESEEQEEKLHKLLIPIWVNFRSRMFPGDAVVEEWWEKRQLEPQAQQTASTHVSSRNSLEVKSDQTGTKQFKELKFAKSSPNLKPDDTDDEEEDDQAMQQDAAKAATGLLRLAVGGIMINNMSKMQKWKLKRELKKQAR